MTGNDTAKSRSGRCWTFDFDHLSDVRQVGELQVGKLVAASSFRPHRVLEVEYLRRRSKVATPRCA
jgi:hypothetical protein